tara:strand:+ start:4112 stop:4324 length:213 start_codon:yes stop_codon:yes gene_type:complete
MKITKRQLKRIIKEEKSKLLNENRQAAFAILEELEMMGVSAEQLVNYLVGNWMTGADALEALEDFKHGEL